jgi:phosphatidylserine decarboxylase
MTHLATPPTSHDTDYLGPSEHTGRAVDVETMKRAHANRLVVKRGALPPDFTPINDYQKHVKFEITHGGLTDWNPEVVALGRVIEREPFIRMYFEQMLQEVPDGYRHFETVEEALKAFNYVVHSAPIFKDSSSIAWQFPLSSLMNFWMMTPSGKAVLRMPQINSQLNRIMKSWCDFLNSPESCYVLNAGPEGWFCEAAIKYNNLNVDYVPPDPSAPHWGWKSYNDFFHRDIKPGMRPVSGPGDATVINSPNDGVAWAMQEDCKADDAFWLKSQRYSLKDMLNNSRFTERFIGGTVYQTFVNGGADWHRFTAPIDGTIVETQTIAGYAWTESDTVPLDPESGPYSQGWAAGVATRGLIFIDSGVKPLGTVCVVPIGLTEVSSLELMVKEGDTVKKGDQMGWFSFGGSSFAMVFEPGAINRFLVLPPKHGRNSQPVDTLRTNKQFAVANVK